MTTRRGSFRPHWRTFFEQLEAIGLPELRQRWEEAQHLIRENGVTYNVYGDPRGMDRPWQLDPIPLLISPADAAALEVGLIQRATAARPDPGRPLRAADAAHRRGLAAGAGLRPLRRSSAPATASRSPATATCTCTPPTSGAAPDGVVLRPGRPHAGPLRRRLRAGEPHRALADAARGLPRLPGAAAGPVLPQRSARRCDRSPRTTATTRGSCS